ncbi:aconitase family protein [Gymnodinialimonas sp. 57CJ19]|uniref:3-isopropylmalate dehydratase large subunit n=1 Tax=Gymnodinialimonas sp. 57CJ19 TaxID=3138498 RepID=UPI003134301C
MGMTAGEKILAKASGLDRVSPGDVVYPDPELVICHDGYIASSKEQLDDLGIDRVFDPDRILLVTDHTVLYTTQAHAERGAAIRKAARDWGIRNFLDVGNTAQGHVYPIEKGLVLPGTFAFANDMHCTNNGAVGALVMRTGPEIISVFATGTMWVEVPQTVRINLHGTLPEGVLSRDLGFVLARGFTDGTFGAEWDYRIIECGGAGVDALSAEQRVPLCNTLTEIGVCNVFFEPNADIIDAARTVAQRPFTPVYSDADAHYEAVIDFDLSQLTPQLALPGSPDRAVSIEGHEGRAVDHAVVGSCGSCMYSDMEIVARTLQGNRVAPGTRLFVAPGTQAITARMRREGLIDILQDAGAILLPPGCGPCAGGQMAPMAPGEVSISTVATNTAGRMGAADSDIYLASPATVAASAIKGQITDPRRVAECAA